MEEILGVELFVRGPKQAVPTLFAEVFLEHARAVVRHLNEAGRHASEASEGAVGTVTVASHLVGSNVLLPRAIILLKRDWPRIKVVVRAGTPESLAGELARGDVDLIVGRKGQLHPKMPVRHVDLYEEPFHVVARQGHPALSMGKPTLPQLLGFPWVMPVAGTSLRTELEDLFRHSSGTLPADQIECAVSTTVRTILRETDYLAVMPETIATTPPGLAIIPAVLEGVSQSVVATIPSDSTQSRSAQAMLSCLLAAARQIGERQSKRLVGLVEP
jgi:DNA-binding transcriptional LysR family regulator